MMKIAQWSIGLLLILPVGLPATQQADQQSAQPPAADSLAEASRHVREQKKDQAKAVRVWNDDNIPKSQGVSVVGQSSDASGNSATTTPAADSQNPASPAVLSPENLAALTSELNAAKENMQSLQTDLDILQRKYSLDDQMYLSKPERETDKEAAAQLKSEQNRITELQTEVAEAQKKVDQLQAKIAGAISSANSK